MKKILYIVIFLLISIKSYSYDKQTILSHIEDSSCYNSHVEVRSNERNINTYVFTMKIVNGGEVSVIYLTPDEYFKYRDLRQTRMDISYLKEKVDEDEESMDIYLIIFVTTFLSTFVFVSLLTLINRE